jgi:hypothetical protein
MGIICNVKDECLECFSDADSSGNWNKELAEHDSATARSRTGCLLRYAGCPLTWGSKFQTEIALSSTESEYIALSQSLRQITYVSSLITELQENGFALNVAVPLVKCKAFEDNNGALEMAIIHKLRPPAHSISM